jgi:lambda repressor-like predicted transcriptional regulator
MTTKREEGKRNGSEIVAEYRRSGLTRRGYCEQAGLTESALDYYLRRERQRAAQKKAPELVAVEVDTAPAPERSPGFTLVLRNGRRIESGWSWPEAELRRLVALAEQG